ncbi:MAG: histidine--tRNA ligase [bacterium]|nr:histidine--tRNA ligase [bacterium]
MSELSTDPYKGVRDFYPADWATVQAIFQCERDTLARWGYAEYNASPLERSELYESKGNEEIINEQTYTFEDRGGRHVTLRPEMTPTLARMVAAKRRELTYPLRWFSIGNRFRYERPQKGRLREFYQTDIDLIGLPEGEADLEIVSLASALIKNFGATDEDFVIRLNARTLLNTACEKVGLKPLAVRAYLRLLDKKAKMPTPEFDAAVKAITHDDPLKYIDQDAMSVMITELNRRGIKNVRFDPTLTRGFDYYTGIVFEIFDTNPANPRALFGGGRYDELVALFGGEPIPAVGFAIGDVAFADFLKTHELLPVPQHELELYLGTPKPENIPSAQEMATVLRTQHLRVFVNLTAKSLGDQVREANKRGVPYFAAVGEDEKHSKTLRVKRLASGEERPLALADIAAYIHDT